jgi:uncharacterized protein YciW
VIDAIDKAAGLSPDDALYSARRFRPEFVEGAELCRLSVLQPNNDQQLTAVFRLAARIAKLNADSVLTDEYLGQLNAQAPDAELVALAAGAETLPQPLAIIARHIDLVTVTPSKAEANNMRLLEQAGLNNPQIVALSELIAFVNFQIKVATGLRLMRSL